MREEAPSTAGSAFNLEDLLERVENDRELLRNLLEIFLQDFPRYTCTLKEAVAKGEVQKVQAVSHTLKGMLSNLAMDRASALAAKLEELGRDGQRTGLEGVFRQLEQEVAGLLPEVEKYMREAHG